MSSERDALSRPDLSVVIPSYNSAEWLPSTLSALDRALEVAGVSAQVVVVDDGSTDDSARVVEEAAARFSGEIELVSQSNRGRFLARWAGLEKARSDLVLLLDSRVLLDLDAIRYVWDAVRQPGAAVAWNAHVRTEARTPLVGLFWDVPTRIFWGSYLRAPRPFDLRTETFDRAPKGTGVFLAPVGLLKDAFRHAWPEGDAHLVSDDTKVLRWIAATSGFRLDPGFSAVYRPRTTLAGFVRHTLDRGTLFVDSYAGTSVLRTVALLSAVLAPVVIVAVLVALFVLGLWSAAVVLLVFLVISALAPLVPAAWNRCPPRSLLAYVCILPVFGIPFWLGLARGVIIHRKSLWSSRTVGPIGAGQERA